MCLRAKSKRRQIPSKSSSFAAVESLAASSSFTLCVQLGV